MYLQGDGSGAFSLAGTVPIAATPLTLVSARLDGDGYDDVAVSHTGTNTVEVVYPNGTGGAAVMLTIDGGTSALLATGDYDADGDIDLYSVRPSQDRLDVFTNTSAYVFDQVQMSLWSPDGMDPRSLALADLDEDGDLDLAIGAPGYLHWRHRAPLGAPGSPFDGGSDRPFPWRHTDTGRSVAAGDFTGDGLTDVVLESSNGTGILFINQCGTRSVHLGLSHRISVGQSTEGNVSVWAKQMPRPTGTVTLSWAGGSPMTVTLLPGSSKSYSYARVDFEIAGLPAGFQEVLAEYSGDSNYPAGKATFYIDVTTETTTTTLTGPTEWTYGQIPQFNASVTSSTGDIPTGDIHFGIDTNWWAFEPAPAASWSVPLINAGTYDIVARLGYSETHPTSSVESIEVTVHKGSSSIWNLQGALSRSGQTAWIRGNLDALGVATGWVRLYEGETLLASDSVNTRYATDFDLGAVGLSLGTHPLRIVYEGDSNVDGSSAAFEHTVMPASTQLHVLATASASSVRLDLLTNTSTRVWRRAAGGSWTSIGSPYASYFIDPGLTPGTVYQYYVDNAGQSPALQSNIETVYVGPFTDPDLGGIFVKQVHFRELQTALNAFQAVASQAPLQIDFTGFVLASHITQLRNAINQARGALGMPVIAFGDAPVAGVSPIRALDLNQLREALR